MKALYGVDSMPETAENVATDFHIEREAQDRMALRSQLQRLAGAAGRLAGAEITPVASRRRRVTRWS
jgi:acetyl-CoA acetyltransferase